MTSSRFKLLNRYWQIKSDALIRLSSSFLSWRRNCWDGCLLNETQTKNPPHLSILPTSSDRIRSSKLTVTKLTVCLQFHASCWRLFGSCMVEQSIISRGLNFPIFRKKHKCFPYKLKSWESSPRFIFVWERPLFFFTKNGNFQMTMKTVW